MTRECCQIRYFANAPQHIRQAEFKRLGESEEWKARVISEMKRIKGAK